VIPGGVGDTGDGELSDRVLTVSAVTSRGARRTESDVRIPLRRLSAVGAALVAAVALSATAPSSAVAAPAWAPAATATVHPGVVTDTAGGQCTSNFLFSGSDGAVYLGQAAHCAGTGAATETDGCTAGSLPIGTPVAIDGASEPGTMVYSSWLTMQARGETDADACAFNDLALVRIDSADVGTVNPTVPHWGGPTGLGTGDTALGDVVLSYGNSPIRGGVSALSPKQGASLGDDGNGWSHTVFTLTPGVPGDSGSAFLDADGRAIGVLSTLALLPVPASNGVGDLPRELAYAQQTSGIAGLHLVLGTEPFRGPLL
jgi:hypothetical protein